MRAGRQMLPFYPRNLNPKCQRDYDNEAKSDEISTARTCNTPESGCLICEKKFKADRGLQNTRPESSFSLKAKFCISHENKCVLSRR